ncbi:hypothetical protein CEN46_01720 [Fischerella thermalis CCMEE 5318]|uniref:Uncharacterized protein n=1 Tax=Fischerella thermalis CCMEE 5318 TaxID=2019666 RepID=A0A2N6LNU2_9CYAN|nr:hypothetical protein CEN46_01720 [Fischerella thermalis CCMEE 5318]PMB42141.1 hypothetical protein CEN47_01570 [Fischerella thermalis CCMEE 5319]
MPLDADIQLISDVIPSRYRWETDIYKSILFYLNILTQLAMQLRELDGITMPSKRILTKFNLILIQSTKKESGNGIITTNH